MNSTSSSPASIPNPILRGFNPDPSICRVGEDYYLATSSFEYAPGIPLYHSRDLVNWNHAGYALPSPEHLDFGEARGSLGVWAPTLRHIKGRFHVVFTFATTREWPSCHTNYLVSSESIHGPWSRPVRVCDGGIDPDLFEDEDGAVYYAQNSGLRMAPIDPGTGRLLGALENIFPGCGDAYPEAPHLYRVDGWYYLLLAEGGTGTGHCVTVARSRRLKGPYEPCPHNPVLTNRGSGLPVQAVGHADLVQNPAGEWFAVCLAVRDTNGISHLGRETFLVPVTWKEGWPHLGENRRLTQPRRLTDATRQPRVFSDDFASEPRPLFWNTRMGWGLGLVERGGGRLRLLPDGRSLSVDGPLAWIGLRQPDLACSLRVVVDLGTVRSGQRAGVVAYLNPARHYAFHATRSATELALHVTARLGCTVATLGAVVLPTDAREVTLHLEARPDANGWTNVGAYRFAYALSSTAEPVLLAEADTRSLGASVASVHTGVYLALYAEGAGGAVEFRSFCCEA